MKLHHYKVSSKGCIEQLTKYCGKENQGGGLEGRWSWSEGKEDGRVNLEFIFFVTDANDASCLLQSSPASYAQGPQRWKANYYHFIHLDGRTSSYNSLSAFVRLNLKVKSEPLLPSMFSAFAEFKSAQWSSTPNYTRSSVFLQQRAKVSGDAECLRGFAYAGPSDDIKKAYRKKVRHLRSLCFKSAHSPSRSRRENTTQYVHWCPVAL